MLNACYSEIQAHAIARHINFVIGMNREIGDRAAIEFSVGFYDALGAGCSVETAYKFGCNAIQMAGIPEHLTPVLKRKSNLPPDREIASSHEKNSVNDATTRSLKLEMPSKTVYEFVLTGSVDEVSRQKLEAIVAHLREITGDTSLTLLRIEPGSIKLVLEGSEESFRFLQSLVVSGELKQILEMSVQRVSRREMQLPLESNISSIIKNDADIIFESEQVEWDVRQWLENGNVPEPARQKGWSLSELEVQVEVPRAASILDWIINQVPLVAFSIQKKRKILSVKKVVRIHGINYAFRIYPIDQIHWSFTLETILPGSIIPKGFELNLINTSDEVWSSRKMEASVNQERLETVCK